MRFSRNTFASIHPDLHSGLDAVLLGVRVFYRSRFSPNPLDLSLFSVSICFLVFCFFFLAISTASLFFDQRSNLDRFFFLVSRNRVSFFSQTFLLSFSFFFGEGGEGFLLFFVLEENISSTLKGFDKGYDWLILSFDVRVRPETTIKIQGGIESLGASFDASSKSRPLDSFQRAR